MTLVRPEQLLLRADASAAIGTGHVMRCLALAQAWQDGGGRAVLATAMDARLLVARLRAEAIELVQLRAEPGSLQDAQACVELAGAVDASWVVVDGYHFSHGYQRAIRPAGQQLLVVDDNGAAGRYCADLILNQNLSARKRMYARHSPGAKLLLGPRYALVRRQFGRRASHERRCAPVARKLLVTLGGSDSENVTTMVIQTLGQLARTDWEIVVVAGASNPHRTSLEAVTRRAAARVHLKYNVADMADWMAWADLAISASGSTTWELCCIGVPAVLIALADNQAGIAAALSRAGCAESISLWDPRRSPQRLVSAVEALADDADRRATLSANARRLVDGLGARRVVEHLLAAVERPAEVVA